MAKFKYILYLLGGGGLNFTYIIDALLQPFFGKVHNISK